MKPEGYSDGEFLGDDPSEICAGPRRDMGRNPPGHLFAPDSYAWVIVWTYQTTPIA
jgi:hypothetical protein